MTPSMADPNWTSVLPPLIAIALAIGTKQVVLSLAAGIWIGHTLVAGLNPLAGLGTQRRSGHRGLGRRHRLEP